MPAFVRYSGILIVAIAIGVALYFGTETGWGRMQPVEIVLDAQSPDQAIFEGVKSSLRQKLKALEGRWLWQVSLDEIMQQITDDSRVEQAHISRVFPNKLLVTVLPHRPVLGLVDRKGSMYPVAPDGSLLPPISPLTASDMPLLRGPIFFENQDLRRKAIELMQSMPKEGLFSLSQVSEISWDKKDGFQFTLTRGGMLVKIGEGDIGPKASHIEKVLIYLEGQQLQGRVIDARFAKKVVVRLRNEP